MSNAKIMVVVGERQWTLKAIHLACVVAQSYGIEVVLLHMVPVRHTWFLGTDLGLLDFTLADQIALVDYEQITASYGVAYSVCVFRYAAYVSGLLDAAEQLESLIVFALPPRRLIPLWHEIEVRRLKRALARRHRNLYTLEPPEDAVNWTPSITLAPEMAAALPITQPGSPGVDQTRQPETHCQSK